MFQLKGAITMIKKMLVNVWMLSDQPINNSSSLSLDFNSDPDKWYSYYDIFSEIDNHVYQFYTYDDEETGEPLDISRIIILFPEASIRQEFKDFPEELNVYLVNENMTVKDYLIKRFCIDKEPIPEMIEPTDEELRELWEKKRTTEI